MDVIDLSRNRLVSIRLPELLAAGMDYPMLDRLVSIHRDGSCSPRWDRWSMPIRRNCASPSTSCCGRRRSWIGCGGMLRRVENVYGIPVDIEFACDGEKFYVLQCRSQSQAEDAAPVRIPAEVAVQDVVFKRPKVRPHGVDREGRIRRVRGGGGLRRGAYARAAYGLPG